LDERDEHESGAPEVAEPVTERVRIIGAEPAGEAPARTEAPPPALPPTDVAWGTAIEAEPTDTARRYLGFDSDAPLEDTAPTVALGAPAAGDTPSGEAPPAEAVSGNAEGHAAAGASAAFGGDADVGPVASPEPVVVPDLQHWTEPPTGQVPAVLDRRGDDEGDLAGVAGPAWREHSHEWEDESFEPALLADDETRVGALDTEAEPEHLQWELRELDESSDDARAVAVSARDGWHEAEPDAPDAAAGVGVESSPEGAAPASPVRPAIVAATEDAPAGRVDARRGAGIDLDAAAPAAPDAAAAAPAAPDAAAAAPAAPMAQRVPANRPRPRQGPARRADGGAARRGPPSGRRNVPLAVVTGVGVAAVGLLCFAAGTVATVTLAAVVVTLAAAECFAALRRAGYRPATLLGLFATAGLMIAAYAKGAAAFPLVIALALAATMIWYLVGAERGSPTRGIAATMLGITWVGVLGAFAGLLLAPSQYPDRHGIAFLIGAVVAVVGADVGALVVGNWLGRHPLAPRVSPNKTWEGFVGGVVMAVVLSVLITGRIHPWTTKDAAILGVVAAVVGPIGDLCESLVKRDLGLKDMGAMLPGHGGVLDRFDALLFVLPATYYLVRVLHLG